MKYADFLQAKRIVVPEVGFEPTTPLSSHLFGFQAAVTRWALRHGRAALWLDTGLGKSRCAIEWARCVCEHMQPAGAGRVLILTPLAVAQQFVREGEAIGAPVTLCREPEDARPGVSVTNYDRLGRFIDLPWDGVVLDESSVLKDASSATRNALVDGFRHVRFRLACSATPAPNDHTEIGNHSEFLGFLSRSEMLAMYFVHDGETTQEWRLKGHAQRDFWRWVASWAMVVRKPSDLGFDEGGYDLPPLRLVEHVLDASDAAAARANGLLFGYQARTLSDQRAARRASLADRVGRVAELVNGSDRPWLVWCDLNDESAALAKAIPDAVEVRGSDDADTKEARIGAFLDGSARVLVSKPSICGAGLNMQHCADMAFAGLSHSWEQFYQAVRRCYRFGQERPVSAHVVTSSAELAVLESIKRKQASADAMVAGMLEHMSETMLAGLGAAPAQRSERNTYAPQERLALPAWLQKGQGA